MGIGAVTVREARAGDGAALARLAVELGFEVSASEVPERLALLAPDQGMIVAEEKGVVIGCLSFALMRVVHRPAPVGRISMMVVTRSRRGSGIGRMLVEAAEAELARRGCGLVEVTSNDKLEQAHAFYQRLGYQRTSLRFAKAVGAQ